MRPSEVLKEKRDEVLAVIERSRFENPAIFGSVARGEDDEKSDLDLLVDSKEGASLFDLADLALQLEQVLGVRVDVGTRRSLKPSIAREAEEDEQPL
jgi:predicted nucleotidyltransferase